MNTLNRTFLFTSLFRTLVISVLVLQPMLGVAWMIGVLTVNQNTTVFAWLFTVVNSLQVCCGMQAAHVQLWHPSTSQNHLNTLGFFLHIFKLL